MDSHDIVDALQHLATSLHLNTPIGALTAGSLAMGAFYLARRKIRSWMVSRTLTANEQPTFTAADKASDGETLLVMPDISGYSKFLSSSQATDPTQAKETIIALLDALIRSFGGRLKVAKLEGDAILFYADADSLTPTELGQIILGIYRAFDLTQELLLTRGSSSTNKALSNLDLKVVVHSGHAERFAFRNAIDLIGTDVVLTYRLLKIGLGKTRYIVATDKAIAQLQVPTSISTQRLTKNIPEFGNVELSIFDVPQSSAATPVPQQVEAHRTRQSRNRIKQLIRRIVAQVNKLKGSPA